ncbi:hypothetical protein [Bifidobacterium tissieri]|uniref:hypothetical protein n=1 Tax=Bifidobacterium tissieri TaxID=1630162 RepID=UPI00123C195D|nr:hypothetical protein [Bifidobacterium tissieri]KAA8828312.1 hypothetical protein EM849_11735 [Bifidobacterium tissieri]
MSFPVQNLIVQKRTAKRKAGPLDAPVALYNPDGTPFTGSGSTSLADGAVTGAKIAAKAVTRDKIADGVLPAAASTSTAGLVKKSAAVSTLASNATLEQVVAAYNDLVAKGKAAGFLS